MIEDFEHLVRSIARHHVDPGTDVLLRTGSDELHGEGVATCGDTVRSRIVGTIESAVCSAGLAVGTQGGIPGVACVAVGVAGGGV